MSLTPSPNESPKTHEEKSDFNIDVEFDSLSVDAIDDHLPPPQTLGVQEKEHPIQNTRSQSHLLWQRPSDFSVISSTKPLNIEPNSAEKKKNAHRSAVSFQAEQQADYGGLAEDSLPAVNHAGIQQHPWPPASRLEEIDTNLNEIKIANPLPSPADPTTNSGPQPSEKTTQPHTADPTEYLKTPLSAGSSEQTFVHPEINAAIHVHERVNHQFSEQKKLRSTLSMIAWAFSLVIIVIIGLAFAGGWELWQRISLAETLTGRINTDLRTQLSEINERLSELESSLIDTRLTANTLSDQRLEEATERRMLKEAFAELTIRVDEMDSIVNSRLRSITLSEKEVQNLRKELLFMRDGLATQQNRTASEIATLQRRLEIMENFLSRITQRAEQQQRR